MVEVRLNAFDSDLRDLGIVAKEFKRYLPSMAKSRGQQAKKSLQTNESPVHLQITRNRMETPYKVSLERGVTVSLWQSEGICYYAGISKGAYLTILGLLGISQWTVLKSNPLLKPEDLNHPPGANCLYATQKGIENFALQLDNARVCPGCIDFYHCLGADRELVALLEAIGTLHR